MKSVIIAVVVYLLLFKPIVLPIIATITSGLLWITSKVVPTYVIDELDTPILMGIFIGVTLSVVVFSTLQEKEK